jgi:hypothetical protein
VVHVRHVLGVGLVVELLKLVGAGAATLAGRAEIGLISPGPLYDAQSFVHPVERAEGANG